MNTRFFPGLITALILLTMTVHAAPIDRQVLVARHYVTLTNFDAKNPLSVGNGQFCFTVGANVLTCHARKNGMRS